MRIALGSDHRGKTAHVFVCGLLRRLGHEPVELGACQCRNCDYPDTAYPVADAVSTGKVDNGILVCGTGIGMSIVANKVKGVRAALVHDPIGAEIARRYNDANVLCIAGDLLGTATIEQIIHAWLGSEFEGGRHARRLDKIRAIERGLPPSSVDQASVAWSDALQAKPSSPSM